MKVVCVLGSPRKNGNSETLAKSFLDSAERMGAQTQTFTLNDLSYRGCQACMACKTSSEKCVLRDDLAPVLDAITEADVLVMAQPVYFGQVPGPTKNLIDRMYSLLTPTYKTNDNRSRLAPGKRLVFITTQGNPDPDAFDVFGTYAMFFCPEWFGYESHIIRAAGPDRASDDLMDQAADLAVRLLS